MIKPSAFMSPWLNALKQARNLPHKNFYFVGGRMSGKTLAVVNFAGYSLVVSKKSVAGYFIRKQYNNKNEMFQTILSQIPEGIDVEINRNQFSIKVGKSMIKVEAVPEENIRKKQQKHGSGDHTAQILFIVYEECFQFDEKDFYYISTAFRGDKEEKRYTFYITNPINKNSPFIVDLEKEMPFNLAVLKKDFYQHKIIGNSFYLYNNYKFIKDFISKDMVADLEEKALGVPHLTDMILHGVPGHTEGGIYTKLMSCIQHILHKPRILNGGLHVGIDFGYTADATCAILVGINENHDIYLLDELYIDTKTNISMEADNEMLVSGINNHQLQYGKNITVNTDHDHARLSTLKRLNQNQDISYRLTLKLPIIERVTWNSKMLARNKIFVVNAPNGVREMSLREGDIRGTEPKPLDKDNHSTDAFEYAICDGARRI